MSDTDFFRFVKVDHWVSQSYHSLSAAKGGVTWDKKQYRGNLRRDPDFELPKYTFQKLVAVPCFIVGTTERPEGQFHDIGAKLIWEDIDD